MAQIIIAHGGESPFDERVVVPDGYTFITNETCGKSITHSSLLNKIDFVQGLGEKKYKNPEKYRKEFEKEGLHIFTPGMKCPNIYISFGDHFQTIFSGISIMGKNSLGIFDLPLTNELIRPVSPTKPEYRTQQIFKEDVKTPQDIFKIVDNMYFHEKNKLKNHFKNILENKLILELENFKQTGKIDEFLDNIKIRYTVKELIEKNIIPKGVYYMLMCRHYKEDDFLTEKNRARLKLVRQDSFKQQQNGDIGFITKMFKKNPNPNLFTNRTMNEVSIIPAKPLVATAPSVPVSNTVKKALSAYHQPLTRKLVTRKLLTSMPLPNAENFSNSEDENNNVHKKTVSNASSVSAGEDSEEEIIVPTPATKTLLPSTISHLAMYGKKPSILTRKRGGGDQYYRKDGPYYYVCFHKSDDCFPLDESKDIQKAKAYLKAKENALRPNPALLNRSNRVAHMTRNMKEYNGPRGYNGASGVKNFGGKRRHTRKQRKA
jgi:hypothetical protein